MGLDQIKGTSGALLTTEVHKVLTLEALYKTSLETLEIAVCPLIPEIQEAENHPEMIGEVPQWTQEISPGILEALLLNKDLVHPVAQEIHVTGAHQGHQMMDAFRDQVIHLSSNGGLTKEGLLQEGHKVSILHQGLLVDKAWMFRHRIRKRLPSLCKF